MPSQIRMDQIDVNIIRVLQKDARTSSAAIAKNCGVSTDTISKRVKKMKKTGIIRRTTVLLNPRSFGHDCIASLGVDVEFPYVRDVVQFIGKLPDVIFCTPAIWKYNVFVIAFLRNVGKLSQLKESIEGHPRVSNVTTSIWVDEISLHPENFEFTIEERGE